MIALLLLLSAQDPVATPKGGAEEAAPADAGFDDSVPPAEQKEQGKLFTGTWKCDGKAATDLAPEVPTRVTLSFRNDLGRWLSVKIEEQKSKQNPKATTSSEVWGYSAALGGWVRNGADNQGGFYSGTSTGWVGDRFWWMTDTAKNGKKTKTKDTLTKVSDKELTFERAVDQGGENFRVVYEGTCKK